PQHAHTPKCATPPHQISDRSVESRVLAEVLMATMKNPFYSTLRTKQQLGYLVFSGVFYKQGIAMIYMIIQSAKRSPSYLTERCLEFL
ncbi:unnamed protein product, partial [Hapterophycus canaliculatus]